jgi:hypothetical protein
MSNIVFIHFQVNKDLNICMCSQIVYIIFTIYLIFYVKIILNTILTNQFQNYLLLTFIVQKLLKFCIQLTTNLMEVFMVLCFYLQSSFIYFFMSMSKIASIIN